MRDSVQLCSKALLPSYLCEPDTLLPCSPMGPTLYLAVLPDADQSAAQAVATVESLEARAQAHAEITAQAVAQAREMQETAAAHAQEQAKAIAQATMLQVQAHTLHVSVNRGCDIVQIVSACSVGADGVPWVASQGRLAHCTQWPMVFWSHAAAAVAGNSSAV